MLKDEASRGLLIQAKGKINRIRARGIDLEIIPKALVGGDNQGGIGNYIILVDFLYEDFLGLIILSRRGILSWAKATKPIRNRTADNNTLNLFIIPSYFWRKWLRSSSSSLKSFTSTSLGLDPC